MQKEIAIGIQSFEEIIEQNYFYIDKTDFIKEWWEVEKRKADKSRSKA